MVAFAKPGGNSSFELIAARTALATSSWTEAILYAKDGASFRAAEAIPDWAVTNGKASKFASEL